MRFQVVLAVFLVLAGTLGGCSKNRYAQAGPYGYYRPSYSYGHQYSYGGYYPSYGYGSYGYYPSYSYSLTPAYGYQPAYEYPAYGQEPAPAPGYTFYKEHVGNGRRFPAGWYRKVPQNGLWFRYGAGYEYGTPADPAVPAPPVPPAPEPIAPPILGKDGELLEKDGVRGFNPTDAELQRLRLMLEMLEKTRKP